MKKIAMFFVALSSFVFVSSQAHALTFIASKSNTPGQTNSASVTFTVVNMDLVVTLSNTADFDPQDIHAILTGVFFNIAGDPKLTPVSAQLGTGSSVVGHALPADFDGDVGGEWGYRNDLKNAPLGANQGVSSTNLKWFGGKKYLFPGDNLEKGKSPGGIDFGLTTLNDMPTNNKGNIKNIGLIQETVVLTFAGLPANFVLATDVADVTFQYGKSLKSAEEITGEAMATIPEPNTIMLVAAGLIGVAAIGRRRISSR